MTFSSYNEPFLDLTNSKVRASPSGVGSDPPSFSNHQLNIQKHDLLKKAENLHAALEAKVYTSDSQNDMFEKVYTSDSRNYIFEKVYTSDSQNVTVEKVYTSDPTSYIFEKFYTSEDLLIFWYVYSKIHFVHE